MHREALVFSAEKRGAKADASDIAGPSDEISSNVRRSRGRGAKIIDRLAADIAVIPWGHNLILIEKLKTAEERLWYARKTIEHGWSRAVLVHQIETDLHGRQGRAVTNFSRTFPSPDSDLVHQLLKDPYNFDFLTLADDADERALERSLIERIRDFLLELAHKGAARELTETVGAGTIFVVR
jgi:predicted nuclease of restriction endonuclease-like (RecB) superfamily